LILVDFLNHHKREPYRLAGMFARSEPIGTRPAPPAANGVSPILRLDSIAIAGIASDRLSLDADNGHDLRQVPFI